MDEVEGILATLGGVEKPQWITLAQRIDHKGLDRSGIAGIEFYRFLTEAVFSMVAQSVGSFSERRFRLALVGGLLLAVLARGGFAGQPQELYQAAVPVSGQGVEERNGAIGRALERVLVKITGNRSVGDRKVARGLIAEAAGLVQQYRYEPVPAAVGDAHSAGHLLLVRFDARALRQALRERGLPVWGATRPTPLLWLGVEQGGRRRFFQPEIDADLARVVDRVGRERGIAFLFPLLDLEDLTRLRAGDLWGGFASRVRDASERYGADLVLVGHVDAAGSGAWQLLHAERIERWQSRGRDAAEAMAEGLQEAMDRIAARFAPVAAPGGVDGVLVRVRGIGDLHGFVRVDRFFKSLDAVESVALEQVGPEQALFRLRLRGGAEALARSASLGGVLSAEPLGAALPGVATPPAKPPDLSFRLRE